MSLEIHVTRGHGRPGSTITGSVVTTLAAGSRLYIKDYSISLFGRFTTKVARMDDTEAKFAHREKVFFHEVFRLYEEPVTLSDHRVSSWRFTIPEHPVIQGQKRDPLTTMPKPDPQVLPPSGSLGQGANISYSLEISAFDELSGRLLEATAPLTFSLTREDETVPNKLSVQEESVSDHSRSDSRRMVLECPLAVVQGKPFPVELCLRSETAASTTSNPSTIRLVDCQLQLLHKTAVEDANADDSTWIEEHILSPHGPITKPGPINVQKSNAVSFLCHPTIPVTIMPTFSCFGIQRSYSFSARFKVAFINEVMEYSFAVGEIILMPKETRTEAFELEVKASRFNDPEDDELPGNFMSAK